MPYACHTCQDSFKSLARYNNHLAGPDKLCKAPVVKKSGLIQNNRDNLPTKTVVIRIDSNKPSGHYQQPRLLCSYCNTSFQQRDGFDKHMRATHLDSNGAYQKNFNCDKCSSEFVTKTLLEDHMVTAHESNDCSECADDFNWPDPNHKCYYTSNYLRLVAGDILPSF